MSTKSKSEKTIQEQIEELERQVAWFDSDDFQIEQAVDHYKAAQAHAEAITKLLEDARNSIERVGPSA